MRLLLLIAAFSLGLATAAQATEQAAPDAPPKKPSTALERLGSPARPDAVSEELEAVRGRDMAAQARLARSLGMSGGPAALDGLVELVDGGDARVRAVAFQAAARIGLRHAKMRAAVRWALGRRNAPDRPNAVAALGVVGDGRDVPDLLAIAESAEESAAVQRAAFTGLRAVSGAAKPDKLRRWSAWWSSFESNGPARLEDAIKTFRHDPEHRQIAAGMIARMAWLRLDLVNKHVVAWLRDEDPQVRHAAARIATASRSASLARHLAAAWEAEEAKSQLRAALEPGMKRLGAEIFLAPTEP